MACLEMFCSIFTGGKRFGDCGEQNTKHKLAECGLLSLQTSSNFQDYIVIRAHWTVKQQWDTDH